MKSFAKLAAIAALGALMSLPAPVVAQKKKEGKEAAKPTPSKFSKEFIAAYKPVETALAKKDMAAAKAAYPAVKAAIKNEDDRYQTAMLAYTLGRDGKDGALEKEGLEMLITASATPAEQRKLAMSQRGQISFDAKDYPTAVKYMQQAYDAGFRGNNIETLIVASYVSLNAHMDAINWIQKSVDNAKAAGVAPNKPLVTQGFVSSLKLKDGAKINQWGKELIKVDPRPETYHDALYQFLAYANYDVSEGLDLLRLARASNAMIRESDYKIYMDFLDVRRSPAEAIALIEEGTAKGLLKAGDPSYSQALALAKQNRAELEASLEKDATAALAGASSYSMALSGDTLMGFGKYARAQALYEAALKKGGVVDRDGKDQSDRTRLRLATAKTMQANYAGAKSDLAAITSPNRKKIAEYWLIYIANQGG